MPYQLTLRGFQEVHLNDSYNKNEIDLSIWPINYFVYEAENVLKGVFLLKIRPRGCDKSSLWELL